MMNFFWRIGKSCYNISLVKHSSIVPEDHLLCRIRRTGNITVKLTASHLYRPIFKWRQIDWSVLNILIQLPFLQQIICVDDCFQRWSAEIVRTNFPNSHWFNFLKMWEISDREIGLDTRSFENICYLMRNLKELKFPELIASYQLFLDQKMDVLILSPHCVNPLF